MQSDSSSESESESGSSGQGTSTEVLQALESLAQKVDKLSEESKNSLIELNDRINNLTSIGGNGNLNVTAPQIMTLRVGQVVDLELPDKAIMMILSRRETTDGCNHLGYSLWKGDEHPLMVPQASFR